MHFRFHCYRNPDLGGQIEAARRWHDTLSTYLDPKPRPKAAG